METISAVKFATLHNNKTIFYSHIYCIEQVFNKINSLNHEVILITGSGDIPVSDFTAPKNVRYWFAQNSLVRHDKVIPIPIGIRDSFPFYFGDQCPIVSGAGFHCGEISEKIVTEIYLKDETVPENFLYANFNLNSNFIYRSFLKNICDECDFISYETPVEDDNGYENYYSNIVNHQANFCPAGNGIDTHRIWETLYCKRIPITINCNHRYQKISQRIPTASQYIPQQETDYSIYTKLYSKLPIIVLNSYEELSDKKYLQELILSKKNQEYNLDLLDFNYWKNLILNLENLLEKDNDRI